MRPMLTRMLVLIAALALAACAGLQFRDPVQVSVAGVEALPGEGFEMRMLVKLRVQNPNETPIDFDGVYLRLRVQDKTFATGVSDQRGHVPRFGDTVVGVAVTVPALGIVRQAVGLLDGKPTDKVVYELDGKLNTALLGGLKFQSQGELSLPGASTPRAPR